MTISKNDNPKKKLKLLTASQLSIMQTEKLFGQKVK